MPTFKILLVMGLSLTALALARASAGLASESEGTQVSQIGPVTISVTRQEAEAGVAFKVVMDTHSVNLDGYDLVQLAVLRTELGDELQPESWDAKPGGHHREGTLTFAPTTSDGQPAIGTDSTSMELIIREVGGVPERIFQWAL